MQNFGVTNKEHYGMLWYFLEWSIKQVASNIHVHVISFTNLNFIVVFLSCKALLISECK